MRGFYFNTELNTYYYNDMDGTVSHVKERKKDEFIFSNVAHSQISAPLVPTGKDICNHLSENGFNQLTLVVTDGCNMRCKYCVYSGMYTNSREHTDHRMTLEIAKNSCDIYMNFFHKTARIHPLKTPTVGFYGGEPLMNFGVIKESVEYVNSKYKNVKYTISTNATLLTDEIIDFLVKHNFLLAISLNGNEEENDRLRVFEGGIGTYAIVMEKLKHLEELYPSYCANCVLLCTIDPGTNIIALADFFENGEFSQYKLVRLSQVFDGFTNWYGQYSDERINKYRNEINLMREKYLKKLINGEPVNNFEKVTFELEYKNVLNRSTNICSENIRPSFIGKTGLCVPGSKTAVSPNGAFHICERINYSRSIGNHISGYDFDMIAKLIKEYNEIIFKCHRCPIERLCSNCYVENIERDGSFIEPNESSCEKKRKNQIRNFIEIFGVLEKGFDPYHMLII